MPTIKFLDVSDMPLGWSAVDALKDGWNQESALKWARERAKILTSFEIERDKLEQVKLAMQNSQPTSSIAEDGGTQPAKNVVPLRGIRETETLPEEFSELSLAIAWSEDNLDWKYTTEWRKWFNWDGSRWKHDRIGQVVHKAQKKLVDAANWPGAKNLTAAQRRAICSRKTVDAVVASAAVHPNHATVSEAWDADPFLLGTPDGVIDLRTGEMIEASRAMMITRQTAVSPKRGPMPYWERTVLARCTKGDPEMVRYYQRWAGYMLTGDCREEAFLFVHGQGNSGKSKFVDCLGDLMGDYCTTAKIETLMESKQERHTEEIACLAGARMVRTSEPEEGSRWNEALLKLLTGRDTVSARRLYEAQFTFRPQFKLVITGNFKPSLKSTGEEIRRRMHFVEFPDPVPVNERIQNLPELLREEWPSILQWAIDGCIDWQKNGIGRPDAVVESTKAYLEEEDTLGRWIETYCEMSSDSSEKLQDIYKCYKRYIEEAGEGVVSQKRFLQRLESRGLRKAKHGAHVVILGMQLRDSMTVAAMDSNYDRF